MTKHCLYLYVLDGSPQSKRAIKNLKELSDNSQFKEKYEFKIIDISFNPELAEKEKILATPVLIKNLPKPMRRIIGDLSDKKKVFVTLDVDPESL